MNSRYFVLSRQGNVIRGTKLSGYVSYRGAVSARNRMDRSDDWKMRFVPMKIVKQ